MMDSIMQTSEFESTILAIEEQAAISEHAFMLQLFEEVGYLKKDLNELQVKYDRLRREYEYEIRKEFV
jgi:DNA polymerase IIIc chi subunit